jgi:hypothetical protein
LTADAKPTAQNISLLFGVKVFASCVPGLLMTDFLGIVGAISVDNLNQCVASRLAKIFAAITIQCYATFPKAVGDLLQCNSFPANGSQTSSWL